MSPLNAGSSYIGKSILYVLSSSQTGSGSSTLYKAQKQALELRLPLAVIFCFQPDDYKLDDFEWAMHALEKIEVTLNKLSVTFIVLIGDPKQRLESCIKHLQPAGVYFDTSSHPTRELYVHIVENTPCAVYEIKADLLKNERLIEHPISWDGPVIPVTQLKQRIHSELRLQG